jgi:predicted Fe-Mo cluster-binding NifX family protein
MKTLITSTGNSIEAEMDMRFGRALWFCINDSKTKTHSFIKNPYANLRGGVGKEVLNFIIQNEIQQIISGDFGANVRSNLENLGVQMIIIQDSKPIEEIINQLNK